MRCTQKPHKIQLLLQLKLPPARVSAQPHPLQTRIPQAMDNLPLPASALHSKVLLGLRAPDEVPSDFRESGSRGAAQSRPVLPTFRPERVLPPSPRI